ncbi:hypothetical protein RRG08_055947 [Elysia crispata]|uniref:Apyrase n=1 Tax=Elysia crispata TaxID=231223 RepID=A0AAE0Z896_9GAST|nr:hypothetical protein RRG08_055947 [Elysia crispata]
MRRNARHKPIGKLHLYVNGLIILPGTWAADSNAVSLSTTGADDSNAVSLSTTGEDDSNAVSLSTTGADGSNAVSLSTTGADDSNAVSLSTTGADDSNAPVNDWSRRRSKPVNDWSRRQAVQILARKTMIVRAACIAVLVLCVRAPVGRSCPLSDLDAKAEEVFTNNETQTSVSAESYGVLLDAGSSSTKLKIYKWKKPNSTSSVPNVTLVPLERPQRKFKPGLADIEWGVVGVQTYLLNILQIAQGIVPADQHAETPVFVLATAGFRLLGVDGAREGMENVEEILLNKTLHPFRYTEGSASVLSGEEEGAYAWIAANYLLGFFHDNKPDEESVGVLEMGGGSTQIAFIPRDPLMAEEFQVIMAGRSYSLYVQSYLQFGLNAIRKRLEHKLVSLESCALETADQPCMLDGDSKNITACGNLTIQLQGTGNPAGCQKLYDDLVATAPPQKCYLEPCAIGSVFQPSVKGINFYAISSFVYSLKAAGAVREDETLDLDILWSKAEEYCLQDISKISSGDRGFASANCMEAIYTNELLTKPYGFEKSTRRIKVTSKINGNDIEWALGAMLEFLSLTFTGDPSHLSLTRK